LAQAGERRIGMASIHGGDIYRNHVTMDFSVNVNPLGTPKAAEAAMHEAVKECGRYPDIDGERLKSEVSRMLSVPDQYLAFGNGASELFMAIVHGIRPKNTVIVVPSFYGYEYAAGAAGGEVTCWETKKEASFCVTEDIYRVLTEDKDLLFLANPNNPTGNLMDKEAVRKLLGHCREKGIYVVLDECFIEFCGSGYSMVSEAGWFDNLMIVRAFTKIFSVPGVRLGYLLCSNPALLGKITGQLPEWNLSCFAQAAGCACALETDFMEKTAKYVEGERQFLEEGLRRAGFQVFPSKANFILFYSEEPLYKELLDRGILIRDCRNFRGLRQGFYRVAVKTREENEILLKEIERLLPKEIERRSFEIIEEELLRRGIILSARERMITKRVIHTTADFDYAETLVFSKDAVTIAEELIRNGADIVTDTNMALAGINKKVLAEFGGEARCFMAEDEVALEAGRRGMTRAAVSMEKAAKIKKPVVFAVGNAPTALIRLYELSEESGWKPAFIIGVPVGFVNVEAAKELILHTKLPYIINKGRKGGSNVAAAICNAILYGLSGRAG